MTFAIYEKRRKLALMVILCKLVFIQSGFISTQSTVARGAGSISTTFTKKKSHTSSESVSGSVPVLQSSSTDNLPSSSSSSLTPSLIENNFSQQLNVNKDVDQITINRNVAYINNLMQNLESVLDEYILSESSVQKEQVYNIMDLIKRHTLDEQLLSTANDMVREAGLFSNYSVNNDTDDVSSEIRSDTNNDKLLGVTDGEERRKDAEQRKKWEEFRLRQADAVAAGGRSELNRREVNSKDIGKVFVNNTRKGNDKVSEIAVDRNEMKILFSSSTERTVDNRTSDVDNDDASTETRKDASNFVSNYIARAGGGVNNFDGQTLGIGGLDDVLAQIKRRVWTPLAAPPILLQELGIQPVRGLLLYGKSGNGKSLLARTLGQILSPIRPITIVSGPEIMDKFVGSSEQKLRAIFDNPPDIYEQFKTMEFGEALQEAALHVIIMDEFDAIARARGGKGGSGDQGDAGVARDSVVNQLLAKMDGVAPLVVPTLVIGLTNRRSLIDPALLRPGRFEVHIEVPPPRTLEQRVSILNVHMRHMYQSSRLLVRDAPRGSAATMGNDTLPTYKELLIIAANQCDGFSGASLAAVSRAAASHALERCVEDFAHSSSLDTDRSLLADCVVTVNDFNIAVKDIIDGQGDSDWTESVQVPPKTAL